MKILVVDDESFICDLLEEYLSSLGYSVETASDGEKALSCVREISPDVILLDIRMPGLSGIDVLREIRSEGKEVGVIMLSAFGEREVVEEVKALGAHYYLQKPVELIQLKQLLEQWEFTPGKKAPGK